MTRNYNPHQGKWTLTRLMRREIKRNGGEMPLEDLLSQMRQRGYLKGPLRAGLEALDVEVIDGTARLR